MRKDGESKYDFSSTSLLKTRYTKNQSQKKKCSPGLSKSDGVSEPEVNLCDTNKFLKLGLALRSVILQLVPP